MNRYDIIIIGLGPAGVSAALTAKVRNKNILLIGKKGISEKVSKAEKILNYPGLPEVSGAEMAKRFEEQLEGMGVTALDEQVSAVYAMPGYFAVQTDKEMYESNSVILATGISTGKKLAGEEAYVGRGVSYCATCDAQFYKGLQVAVIGYGKAAEEEAEFLAEVAEEVTYVPMYKDYAEFAETAKENIKIRVEKPVAVEGSFKAETLKTDKGEIKADGIFVLRDSVPAENLVPGLEMDDSGSHAKVDLQMKTNLEGLFACGDIAGMPYQYIKAAGQGNVAALSAVKYLNGK